MWNHLETERKVSIVLCNWIWIERTRRVDGCGREVRGWREGKVFGVVSGGESRRFGVGKVAAGTGMSKYEIKSFRKTYMEISPGAVSPLMRRRQASLVSWMISIAYFLFLASPEKANWFSGLPSGIL